MMQRLATLLQRSQRLSPSRILEASVHRRTLTSAIIHQESSLEFDPTKAYMRSCSSNPLYALLGSCETISSLKKLHSLLIIDGHASDPTLQPKLISSYGQFGDIASARQVFDQIPEPDVFSVKVMIRWYFMNDLHVETIRFYNCLRKCPGESDNVVCSIVLKACSELCDICEGRKVHCDIVKVGGPDSFVLTGLVDMYTKCGDVACSRKMFDEIVDRNVVCWTSMIVGYVKNGVAEEALVLFNWMRNESVEGNEYTLGSLVTACTKLKALHQGKWIHGYIIKNGVDLNSHLMTSLVDMYAKCGIINDARSIFDELSTIDLVSWTSMIVGYAQCGYPNQALALFQDKKWINILPNSVTIASVISACAQSGNVDIGRIIHCLTVKLGSKDVKVDNALVDMYAKCGLIGDAHYLFERVSNKDVVTWNSLIHGYAHNGSNDEAMRLFRRMRLDSFQPDTVTLVTLLSACASAGSLEVGSSLHAYSIKEGLLSCSNVYIGTALLDLYAKCGELKSARLVFDGMEEKNTVSWTVLISGYGMHGDCTSSIALFEEMLKGNLGPNNATFTAVLSACSHAGKVGDGWKYFNLMCRQFKFVPSMEHYVCIVDLLARAGRLEEAMDFIEKMPVKPDVRLFGAFLHGCSLHSKFDLGEVAVRRMLELHPYDACYYVLMSNLYASDGRWSQSIRMRELIKTKDLSKLRGCSVVAKDIDRDIARLGITTP